MTDPHYEPDPIVYRYTRQQAMDDGVLVDLTEWAKETGFHAPVACTAAVWHGYVVPREGLRSLGQSQRGRGHDLLWMLYHAIRRSRRKDQLRFQVIFLMDEHRRETVTLKAVYGPGDEGEPVLTIMLPNED